MERDYHFIYGELGRVPVRIYKLIAAIRFWFKILHSDDTKYIKVAYNTMYDDRRFTEFS